jgi:hypothetical protein
MDTSSKYIRERIRGGIKYVKGDETYSIFTKDFE